jgi:hypothetical protein
VSANGRPGDPALSATGRPASIDLEAVNTKGRIS